MEDLLIESTSESEDKISGKLEEDIASLEKYVDSQPPEDVIQVRIQQYGLSRLLVNVHKRSAFILVKGTTNLG